MATGAVPSVKPRAQCACCGSTDPDHLRRECRAGLPSEAVEEVNPMRMAACTECGMHVGLVEYHPYAACLMFKQTHNSETVRQNLAAVVEFGRQHA